MRRKKLQKSEAGDLKSIRETIGFPAAPHVHGLLKKDMDEDYEVLGVCMCFKFVLNSGSFASNPPLISVLSIHTLPFLIIA